MQHAFCVAAAAVGGHVTDRGPIDGQPRVGVRLRGRTTAVTAGPLQIRRARLRVRGLHQPATTGLLPVRAGGGHAAQVQFCVRRVGRAHRRLQEPNRGAGRRLRQGTVLVARTGRHQARGGLHGGRAERLQRGRVQRGPPVGRRRRSRCTAATGLLQRTGRPLQAGRSRRLPPDTGRRLPPGTSRFVPARRSPVPDRRRAHLPGCPAVQIGLQTATALLSVQILLMTWNRHQVF